VASEPKFQAKILRRQTTPDEYRVYRAGLEWDLTDPIVIENADDFKSKQRWRDRLTPYHHQVTNLITFCRRLPVTLLADDVGLGKTISAGLIISELIARARVSKILIVCPKVLGPQWKEELESKFGIEAEIAIGRELASADPTETGAVITTYNSARLHLDAIPEDRFQMLILDEAHKLRNLYGVENPPQVAQRFRQALEKRRFRFVLMLTATPIQNRLWDLFSLVDLLTVARGHQNPFGSEGQFARRFIADNRSQARQLKPEAKDEFRSIVYGYMSRVRRGDAKLYFPDRVVQMHRVNPTSAELRLIEVIAKPIQKLNRLVQISILQALTSSPEALNAQLSNMARNGTVPAELAAAVRSIVTTMPSSSKLDGLGRLIAQLKKETPEDWRLVVFTTRRETQTTIQIFLERLGLTVGLINGDSGARNQETISRFRQNPPRCRIIVSTEAGSEGVNLQIANVLVNYDLPWNPMIVEQRIGRIQRLGSKHAHVSIFNIMLRGTFEEYIVGRLMEKLQMAAHAIGDIEALLQGSDIGDGDSDSATSFEDRILQLVLAALAGKDVEKHTRLEEDSIENAKAELAREEATINAMLGSMDGVEYVGPRAPNLPPVVHSMEAREFVQAAFGLFGGKISPVSHDRYLVDEPAGREYIRFEHSEPTRDRSILYAPGSPHFQRLVARVIATGVHSVVDNDQDPASDSDVTARRWVESFSGVVERLRIESARRLFEGNSLLRVRATVAHDSYERLANVTCKKSEHRGKPTSAALNPLPNIIEDPVALGIDTAKLSELATYDAGISEFARFYLERREQECKSASGDERKQKKLYDEFSPRLEATMVGLTGTVHREVEVFVDFTLDGEHYDTRLNVIPHTQAVVNPPEMQRCAVSGKFAPVFCISKCEVSDSRVLRHLLKKSTLSGRFARAEYFDNCCVTGKLLLRDELEKSAVTGNLVTRGLLKTSALSGKRAEPEHFTRCAFTNVDLLHDEVAVSDVSGKQYRKDEQMQSAVSGKTGHKSEFVICHESRQNIAANEAEICELTGKKVRPGILAMCDVTGKRVLPSELDRCATTGKRALKRLLVTSSVSHEQILEEVAIRSASGLFCLPAEAKTCFWSGRQCHPDDIRICALTGLPIHYNFATSDPVPRLRPLVELLDGSGHAADDTDRWPNLAIQITAAVKKGKCRVEAAETSPTGKYLAVSSEVRTLLGVRVHHAGAVVSIEDSKIVGRLVEGRRVNNHWTKNR
jgi:superfamily II DNA or RNA helicase